MISLLAVCLAVASWCHRTHGKYCEDDQSNRIDKNVASPYVTVPIRREKTCQRHIFSPKVPKKLASIHKKCKRSSNVLNVKSTRGYYQPVRLPLHATARS